MFKKQKIIFYGFDVLGYEIPTDLKENDQYEVFFLDMDEKIEEADGIVIPQSIFERHESVRDYNGTKTYASCKDPDLVISLEKKLNILVKKGTWVCFLVEKIVDYLQNNGYVGPSNVDISNLDLTKKVLNKIGITKDKRSKISANTDTRALFPEFEEYMNTYGIFQTVFAVQNTADYTILAINNTSTPVGFAFKRQYIFLPFHTIHLLSKDLESLVSIICKSIYQFRSFRSGVLPVWTETFKFEQSEKLTEEIGVAKEKLKQLKTKKNEIEQFKRILVATGEDLRENVINIFKSFFCFNLDCVDIGREDFSIQCKDGQQILVEVKQTAKGIAREHINQVDSHRERNGFPSSNPALLIINCNINMSDINKRLNSTVDTDQIKHARLLNVLIIRTIDLLFFMKKYELDPNACGTELLKFCNAGGGLLKILEDGSFKVVKE